MDGSGDDPTARVVDALEAYRAEPTPEALDLLRSAVRAAVESGVTPDAIAEAGRASVSEVRQLAGVELDPTEISRDGHRIWRL